MCGRVKTPEELAELKQDLRIDWDRMGDYEPRYNAAPTTLLPVVTSKAGERSLEPMRWGLIPSWAKDLKIGFSSFNARADGIATKSAFRGAWRAGRRCLVVTSGFYEWRKADKQPFCVTLGNRGAMLMAGLWDEWKTPAGERLRSCTIITTDANPLMLPVHDRMPVILGPEDWAAWLGEEALADPTMLLKPFPERRLTLWPVGRAVGNVKNEGPALAQPI